MNATSRSQPGGTRQPKPLNSPKASPDNTTNDSSSPCSQLSFRAGKRDRAEPASQPLPVKRDPDPFARAIEEEASSDSSVDVVQEISRITEMGGLKNPEVVEKILKLMQLDRTERKIDLTGRVMLAGIIAGSDAANDDCLVKFVQMRGVPILDEWLKEAHKGTKQGEPSNGKAVEELLLALLRALEKLPINLNTLRTCHIGKSVNHLRGHKNLEVQRKARFLVDIWKRRVDEEMKAHELKGGPACQAQAQTQLPASRPMHTSKHAHAVTPKLQVSVDFQNKTGEAEQSPNSSSSFGSNKSGPIMGAAALRHQRRAVNGQLHHRTSTGPVTRSSDVPVPVPENSIGQRIVARMSNVGRSPVTEDLLTTGSKASSPVHAYHVQGGKSKNEVKEDKAGSDEGQNEEADEKCAESGRELVTPDGNDLGMLASVATREITKKEPSSLVKEEACVGSRDNDIDNEKNGKGENKCEIGGDRNNLQPDGETMKGKMVQFDNEMEGKNANADKAEEPSVKCEKTEGETRDLETTPIKRESMDEMPGSGPDKPTCTSVVKMESGVEKATSAALAEAGRSASAASSVTPDTGTRVEFDLNEGILPLEDGPQPDREAGVTSTTTSYFSLLNPPFAPRVTVAAPAKGPFNPPENLLRPVRGGETGWRGSGPTSAFRPAEPRRVLDMSIGVGPVGSGSGSDPARPTSRPLLEFDLNVPDERALEDDVGTGQKPVEFGLDLNRTDAGPSGFRDFDLNGPGGVPDESGADNPLTKNQHTRVGAISGNTIASGNMQFLSQSPGLRLMNSSDTGQLWFPSNASFPGSVPGSYSIGTQRMVGPFGTADLYRGPAVGPGTHTVPYLGHGQVQFPFGFPPSTASSYQSMVAPTNMGVGLGQGQRPFILGHPEGSSSFSVGSAKWGPVGRPVASSGLDLNAGPGMVATGEVRGVVHVNQVLGGKRAEPDGGWDHLDRDRSSFGSNKQLSWQ